MERRLTEMSQIHNFIEGVDKEVSTILQCLGWDKKRLLEDVPKATCSYNQSHKFPQDKMDNHERQCFLKSNGYLKDDLFLPDPLDINANTLIKFDKQASVTIINNASCGDPLFKQGNRGQSPEPWTLARLQASYTVDERRALHDAVVQAVPSCHDLADLALPSDRDQEPKAKSRAEILAELRDMKRRRTKYRVAPKTRKYSDVLRDVIKTQMEFYTDAKQQFACDTVEKSFEHRHQRDYYDGNPRKRIPTTSGHEEKGNRYERSDPPSTSYYERQRKNRARERTAEEAEDRRVGRSQQRRDSGTNDDHQTVRFSTKRSREHSASLEKDTHYTKRKYRESDMTHKSRKDKYREREKSSNGSRNRNYDYNHSSDSRTMYRDDSSLSECNDSHTSVRKNKIKKSKKFRYEDKGFSYERSKRRDRKSTERELHRNDPYTYKSSHDESYSTENVHRSSRKVSKDGISRDSYKRSHNSDKYGDSSISVKIERDANETNEEDNVRNQYRSHNESYKKKNYTRRNSKERDQRYDQRRFGDSHRPMKLERDISPISHRPIKLERDISPISHRPIKLERDISPERPVRRPDDIRYENYYASTSMTNKERYPAIRVKEEVVDPVDTAEGQTESLNSRNAFKSNKFCSTSGFDERGKKFNEKYDYYTLMARHYEKKRDES